jgi:SAM-dependent methyltransferase
MSEPPEHVRENRTYWNEQADQWVALGEQRWAGEPQWGIWKAPEEELEMLPVDMAGMQAIELGCGTAYVSAWMARRGASVVGIDVSERQLASARRLAERNAVELTLVQGNAETVPYADASFDFAISEYGAAIWCDPYVWIPEAHRLLRPGGTLEFLCMPKDGSLPITEQLERDYFDMHRFDWRDAQDEPGGIEFNLPISGWFALFRKVGFEVLDFREIRAPHPGPEVNSSVTADWAYRWPSEQVWKLRRSRQPRRNPNNHDATI